MDLNQIDSYILGAVTPSLGAKAEQNWAGPAVVPSSPLPGARHDPTTVAHVASPNHGIRIAHRISGRPGSLTVQRQHQLPYSAGEEGAFSSPIPLTQLGLLSSYMWPVLVLLSPNSQLLSFRI